MSRGYEKYHRDYVQTSVQRSLINRHNLTYINFFRFVLPLIQKNKPRKILDVGSGAGTLSLYLGGLGYRVVAVEPSKTATIIAEKSAEKLRLEDKVKFFNCRFEDFRYRYSFDLVLCLEVLEHCFDDSGVLSKIYDNLRSGGKLVLSTPLKSAPLVRLGLVSEFDKKVGHLRRYVKDEVFAKLKNAGFVVDSYIETEGIIRNSLFVFPKLGFVVKFLKSYLSDCFTLIDDLSGKLFGYSDLIVVAEKKEKTDKTDKTEERVTDKSYKSYKGYKDNNK